MSAPPRKSLGEITNEAPPAPPVETAAPIKPPAPPSAAQRLAAAAAAARPPIKSSGYGQRLPPAAATRIAAVARGRTGRRRSMEIRNARPTTSTSRGPRSVINRTTTASRRRDVRTSQTTRAPSTDRWNSTARSSSRPQSTNMSRSALMPCARAPAARDAPPPERNVGEIDSEAAIRAAAQIATVLESVGMDAVVPGLFASTFAGSSDEDIARTCEKMRAPPGARWDVSAKIKMRDEKLREVRTMLSRVAEQRRAFGTLASKIEEKLLKNTLEERDRADKADRALIVGSGLGDRLEKLEAQRDAAVEAAKLAEVKLAAAEEARAAAEAREGGLAAAAAAARESRDAARSELARLKEASMRDAGLVEGTVAAGQSHTAALEARARDAERERDAQRDELALLRAGSRADGARAEAEAGGLERLLREVTAERDAARLDAGDARRALAEQTTLIARAEGKAEAAAAHAADARAALLAAQRDAAEAEARAKAADTAERRRFSENGRDAAAAGDRAAAERADAAARLETAERRAGEAEAARGDADARLQAAEAAVRDAAAALAARDAERAALEDAAARADGAAATLREALQAGEARERELSARLDRTGAVDAARGEALETRAAAAEAKRDELTAEVLALTAQAAEHRLRAEALEGRAGAAEDRARVADERGAELARARDAATAAAAHAEARHTVEASLRAAIEEKEAAERRERTAALAQLMALQTKQESDAEAHRATTGALRSGRSAGEAAFAAGARLAERALALAAEEAAAREAELTSLKAEVERANEVDAAAQARALAEARGACSTLTTRLEAAEAEAARARAAGGERLEVLEEKLRGAEATRRKLHNTIQELRGNIRVFARVRPFLPGDGDDDARKPAVEPGADGVSLALAGEGEVAPRSPQRGAADDKRRPRKREQYSYDRVFGPEVGQEEVFGEVGEFVQSALDGYQVCLLSYGQTGSGKTHTMQGAGSGPMRGIIPRAMEQVAAYCAQQKTRGWAYEMEVTYVEIYNEQVRDLLGEGERTRDFGRAEAQSGLEIRRDPKTGRVFVDGCTRRPIDPADAAAVDALVACAARHRCVASTEMNAVSSRSHAVFTLHLTGTNVERRARLRGALHLVDLAGSERLDRSHAQGQRLKEAQSINKSLSALAGVFASLNAKRSHIPYRDSRLTFLLQPALSGDGKTLLFVNLSPTAASANESLCSLRFAKQVNQVELGKASRSVETV